MTIRQLPDFAFRSATDYAAALEDLHARYDPLLGRGASSTSSSGCGCSRSSARRGSAPRWSCSIISIVVCTLDRTPRLWRGVSDVRVAQPEPFFDPTPARPRGDGRRPAEGVRAVLRRNGFRVREATDADGTRFLYGDRHQYTKLATLFTHLGLILFLVAAAATSRLGDEQGLVVAEGESLTVQPIGTPGLLLVKNLDFEAPGFETGPGDRLHDRPGRLPGRPGDRAQDDPGQRPAVGRRLHVPPERVRAGAAPRPARRRRRRSVGRAGADDRLGRPACRTPRSASPAATSACSCCSTGRPTARAWSSSCRTGSSGPTPPATRSGAPSRPVDLHRGDTKVSQDLDLSIGLDRFGEYTLLIAKRDPGQGLVWLAFALPDRRDHDHVLPAAPPGLDPARARRPAGIVWRSDRYIDVEREFGRLLDQLVAARRPGLTARRRRGRNRRRSHNARARGPVLNRNPVHCVTSARHATHRMVRLVAAAGHRRDWRSRIA